MDAGLEHGLPVGIDVALRRRRKLQSQLKLGFDRRLIFRPEARGRLLRLQDEAIAAIKVDLTDRDAPIVVMERDGALEYVGVFEGRRAGRVRMREFEEIAKLGEEEILVGALGKLGVGPAGDEMFDRRVVGWSGGHASVEIVLGEVGVRRACEIRHSRTRHRRPRPLRTTVSGV